MTTTEWDLLNMKEKLEVFSEWADLMEDDNYHDHCALLRRIVKIGEDKLSVDTILRAVLRWGQEDRF